jgi:hypothetical protein
MTENTHRVPSVAATTSTLDAIVMEVERQDQIHPDGYPATRDGIRLAIVTGQDELNEALLAWRAGRCKCPTPRCDHHDWEATAEELTQAAAVILRAVRSIRERRGEQLQRKVDFFENRRMP